MDNEQDDQDKLVPLLGLLIPEEANEFLQQYLAALLMGIQVGIAAPDIMRRVLAVIDLDGTKREQTTGMCDQWAAEIGEYLDEAYPEIKG